MTELHWTEVGKNALVLIRDLFVLGIVVFFLFFPIQFGEQLGKTNIGRFSAFGVEVELQAKEVRDQAEAAEAEVAAAQEAVDQTLSDLRMWSRSNPQIRPRANQLEQKVEQSSQKLTSAKSEIQQSIKGYDTMVRKIEAAQ
ncbi:hypothetical protein [Parasphingorhabdus cellanae]|uniref:Uncharacterized protein n=1 Tax=Parasphingorhabdus cellanae TaxID=2806553 RepID=A0ABX7T4F6_9SPHN|nr:hypothetical protein [Parasphingorhabdus cellanae]QTD55700.1 hypothetical protein J4G78_16130 [Parasphingorhabdus cellanae]